jgi:hypothetical protein
MLRRNIGTEYGLVNGVMGTAEWPEGVAADDPEAADGNRDPV